MKTPHETALITAIRFLVVAGIGGVLLVMIVGPLMGGS